MKFEWEKIEEKHFGWTERAKVPGGWALRTIALGNDIKLEDGTISRTCVEPTMAMIFIPDVPGHEWVIDENIVEATH